MYYAVYVTDDDFENPNPFWIKKRLEKDSDEALRKSRWYKSMFGYRRAKIVRESTD